MLTLRDLLRKMDRSETVHLYFPNGLQHESFTSEILEYDLKSGYTSPTCDLRVDKLWIDNEKLYIKLS